MANLDPVRPVQTKPIPPSARTVVVCCKIPNGLQLQLQRDMEKWDDERGGPVKRTYKIKSGAIYYVAGPAYPQGGKPKNFPREPMVEGGYALTPGVPAEFWEEWLRQNRLAPYVQPTDGAEHGMIFAYPSKTDAIAAAREQEKLMSGLEPLSTEVDEKTGRLTDPRMPRSMNSAISVIRPDYERMSERGD
jgi:hypothetical protein